MKYGFELFQNTPKYIGPSVEQLDKVFSGNNLACGNCHLLAGTKPFAASLVGVVNRFPQYRGREHKLGTDSRTDQWLYGAEHEWSHDGP